MKSRIFSTLFASSALLGSIMVGPLTSTGCLDDESDIEDGENDSFPTDGKADGISEGSREAAAVLALVNDRAITVSELRNGGRLSNRVATRIIKKRDGADALPATADDDTFDTLAELDAVPFVGATTLRALVAFARSKGLLTDDAPSMEVVFSPQPAGSTHTDKIAGMIRNARKNIDIAMYSFSDADIGTALADAVRRGVKVRFLFETAGTDKSLTDAALQASKSGKLEANGINVRFVNKILHHKFVLIDGPRDDAGAATTGALVTGSANWSFGGAQSFDENTIFIRGSAKTNLAFQHEFNILWEHSRDFALATPLQFEKSLLSIDNARLPADSSIEPLFTSPNYTPGGADGASWKVDTTKTVVADQWVKAIANARTSIHIASGHLRLRSVAEALIAKRAASPNIDIKVYLDQQEYISQTGHAEQVTRVAECVTAATTDAAKRDCQSKDFLFARQVADANIDVRVKSYAYRWDHSYAVQMHNKYMIIDGKELYSGSYNLSMNAEQGTFENCLHLSGPSSAAIVGQFETNFAKLWNTGRNEGVLQRVRTEIATAATIPLVFTPVSLTMTEFNDLRNLIRDNCSIVDSAEFRNNAAAHRVCQR
jgi:phosphatidylserine/phosphatidylglycerophosphate/cardiolipin synthase-like enzyme